MIIENNKLLAIEKIDIHEGKVLIPMGVKTLETNSCVLPNITELILSESITTIKNKAIHDTNITNLILPQSITTVEVEAICDNEMLKQIVVLSTRVDMNNYMVRRCPNLLSIKIGSRKYTVITYDEKLYEVLNRKAVGVYDVLHVQLFKSHNPEKGFLAVKQNVFGYSPDLQRAIEACRNNYLTPNLIEMYRNINLDSTITGMDYKLITGACDHGVDAWLKENGLNWNSTKTVRELLVELKGAHGYRDFSQFVADRYKDRVEEKE